MKRFRQKPVTIEAARFSGTVESANDVLAWIGSNGGMAHRASNTDPRSGLLIETTEGVMRASDGDWVIRGVKGEFYPCKPDIFEATYEAAD